MKVLVTGASGFVGPHLVEELLNAGHEVCTLDRSTVCHPRVGEAGHAVVDLTDSDAVSDAIRSFRCDAVAHLAGWSHVGRSWKEPVAVFEVNLCAAILLYKAAAACMGETGRFLFVSSADIYGTVAREKLPITEDFLPHPESPYALSKFSGEKALRLLRRTERLPVLVARPFNHIGPGQHASFVCPSFAQQVAEIAEGERDMVRHGNLTAKRDFLDVRDVVRAYRLMLERGADGDVFNICAGRSVSIRDLLLEFFDIAGIEPRMELNSELLRPVDTPDLRGSCERLRAHTGWEPRIELRRTLEDIYAEAQARIRARV